MGWIEVRHARICRLLRIVVQLFHSTGGTSGVPSVVS